MPPTCYVGNRPLRFLRPWGQGCPSDPPGAASETGGHMQDEIAEGIHPRHGELRGPAAVSARIPGGPPQHLVPVNGRARGASALTRPWPAFAGETPSRPRNPRYEQGLPDMAFVRPANRVRGIQVDHPG